MAKNTSGGTCGPVGKLGNEREQEEINKPRDQCLEVMVLSISLILNYGNYITKNML